MENDLQRSLFDVVTMAPTVQPTVVRGATIDQRCDAFIAANPQVWQTFVTLCLEMKRRGLRQWSSKAAFEAMRFMATLQSVGDDYKLPNDYTSRFSRRAMKEVPELDGFFEVRKLQDGACN